MLSSKVQKKVYISAVVFYWAKSVHSASSALYDAYVKITYKFKILH